MFFSNSNRIHTTLKTFQKSSSCVFTQFDTYSHCNNPKNPNLFSPIVCFSSSSNGNYVERHDFYNKNVCVSFDQTPIDYSDSESDDDDEKDDNDEDFGVLEFFDNRKYVENGKEKVVREVGEEEGKGELRNPLVKKVSILLRYRNEWNSRLENELRHLLRILKPRQVCAVIRSLDDERVAQSFFYWADRQWKYRHDPVVYHTMLEILSKTKLCKGSKRVLRLMIRRRIERRPEHFGCVMKSYSRAGELGNAMHVLRIMQKAGIGPDLSICNTAVHALVMANRLKKALWFVDQMECVGVVPDVVTYNILIKGYCNLHRVEDALELIDQMLHKGKSNSSCLPDKASYYTVMCFLCKDKRMKEVRELLGKMADDSHFLLDQKTYTTLIHSLSKNGHGEEAFLLLRESEEKDFQIDKAEYSVVVHSFCQQGNLEKAKEIINEMFLKGCIPDVVTYTTVINGLCRTGKIDGAKKMIINMYKHGCKPNTVSYTALLNGLCKIEKSLEAREMLYSSKEECWTPNLVTYSVVVHGLRREGKIAEACDLVHEMVKKGFFPTPAEVNLLTQSLLREGKVSEAKKFMEECLRNGVTVNVVNYTTLIHGFCQKGDFETALSLFDDMYLSNRYPDVFTYTTLIDALSRKGRFEEATALTKKMLNKGVLPTPVTYRIVIHRYCAMGRIDDLMILLEKMLEKQYFGTAYNQVLEKLCSFENLEEAYKLLGKILKMASRKDANTCHFLMESFLKKGNPLLSYKVACRMFESNLIPNLNLCKKVSKILKLDGKSIEAERLMVLFIERGRLSLE
ncbi:hypothetical protein GIB67_014386 [Kingdonia uniflora]|uniref:Pentatricopeptide repeat-containing protein n=1 Tax=Kingdonia uniflora TaxID=39325 RepID=A0A7J7LYS7_9MAGN|nr:hypothetical protein GIB67_014386 [Kingdonia uniflora]